MIASIITVETTIEEMHPEEGYRPWGERLYAKLKAAGIPVLPDGTLEHGSILKVYSPTDWGKCIYHWQPDQPS